MFFVGEEIIYVWNLLLRWAFTYECLTSYHFLNNVYVNLFHKHCYLIPLWTSCNRLYSTLILFYVWGKYIFMSSVKCILINVPLEKVYLLLCLYSFFSCSIYHPQLYLEIHWNPLLQLRVLQPFQIQVVLLYVFGVLRMFYTLFYTLTSQIYKCLTSMI